MLIATGHHPETGTKNQISEFSLKIKVFHPKSSYVENMSIYEVN